MPESHDKETCGICGAPSSFHRVTESGVKVGRCFDHRRQPPDRAESKRALERTGLLSGPRQEDERSEDRQVGDLCDDLAALERALRSPRYTVQVMPSPPRFEIIYAGKPPHYDDPGCGRLERTIYVAPRLRALAEGPDERQAEFLERHEQRMARVAEAVEEVKGAAPQPRGTASQGSDVGYVCPTHGSVSRDEVAGVPAFHRGCGEFVEPDEERGR